MLLDSDQNALLYKSEIAGYEGMLYYNFNNNDDLYLIGYIFTNEHSNKTKFVDDYYKVQSAVKDKFGEPLKEDIHWNDDLWKDNPESYGLAIITGDLAYTTRWDFNDYTVDLLLGGDNYKVSFGLLYSSKVYPGIEKNSGL